MSRNITLKPYVSYDLTTRKRNDTTTCIRTDRLMITSEFFNLLRREKRHYNILYIDYRYYVYTRGARYTCIWHTSSSTRWPSVDNGIRQGLGSFGYFLRCPSRGKKKHINLLCGVNILLSQPTLICSRSCCNIGSIQKHKVYNSNKLNETRTLLVHGWRRPDYTDCNRFNNFEFHNDQRCALNFVICYYLINRPFFTPIIRRVLCMIKLIIKSVGKKKYYRV